jgi:hypothetical protein
VARREIEVEVGDAIGKRYEVIAPIVVYAHLSGRRRSPRAVARSRPPLASLRLTSAM